MKFSQATVVAFIGSATLVSAIPRPQSPEIEARGVGSGLRLAGVSAVRAAGGKQAVAQQLGSLVNLYQTQKANQNQARDFLDEDELALRDLADWEDELEARAPRGNVIGKALRKVGSAINGHKVDIALAGASIAATAMGGSAGAQRRDLDLRDLEAELIARGIFGDVFRKIRGSLKHNTDAAITGASSNQQRDFDDELEMRDFGFDLNELD